jgi:hypothetical protein
VFVKAPLSEAVTVAVWIDDTVPAVALKVVDDELAGTVTDAGTGSAGVLLEDNVTVVPPVGASWVKLTVQVVDWPEVRLDGLQEIAEIAGPPPPAPLPALNAAI